MNLPGVVDDEDPDQAGAQHAADHSDHNDPGGGIAGGGHTCTRSSILNQRKQSCAKGQHIYTQENRYMYYLDTQ